MYLSQKRDMGTTRLREIVTRHSTDEQILRIYMSIIQKTCSTIESRRSGTIQRKDAKYIVDLVHSV